MCFFTSVWKFQWSFNFLQKQYVWEKSGSWVYGPKTSRPLIFKPQYLTNKLRYEIEFLYVTGHSWKQQINGCCKWMWPGILGHAQSDESSKSCFILRISWVMKLVFCVWLGINRSNKLTHSFQVGVVRHSQSDLKQWLRIILGLMLIRMNLVMMFIFCRYTQIHLFDSVH